MWNGKCNLIGIKIWLKCIKNEEKEKQPALGFDISMNI